ncbi:flavodoxin domain-containing protein [Levilactobacillus zymae]|uniref:flavodoxin domain-containing protein n=1 Tax=Levilactobacillus zymae TaxID=267363 RepID=UPI0028BB1BE5|nr:flavodoxin domain-containing protein [Levilactobacillus zymae]MDT6979669.1 flavodoxin domain-containing protein [Levilactobacillus zymae]
MTPTIQIIFASLSGRNQAIAMHLQAHLAAYAQTVVTEISQADAFSVPQADAVILVSYTYHDGELPDEALDFYDDLAAVDLQGTHFAVCGSSSTQHAHYGRAVDRLAQRLTAQHGVAVAPVLKIDGDPNEADRQRLDALATQVLTTLDLGN